MNYEMQNNPFVELKTMIRMMVGMNIYRIQRDGEGLYPPFKIPEADKSALSVMYSQFEEVWRDTYEDNPYAIFTGGQVVEGINSEITIHVNNLENIVNVTYSILTEEGHIPITYPMQVKMQVVINHPLTSGVLYIEAIGEREDIETVHEGTIVHLSRKYPALPKMWNHVKSGLRMQMKQAQNMEWIDDEQYHQWNEAIEEQRLMLYIHDEEAMNFPSVVMYSGELEQDGRNVQNRATATLMEPAFTFRHDKYEPFETII